MFTKKPSTKYFQKLIIFMLGTVSYVAGVKIIQEIPREFSCQMIFCGKEFGCYTPVNID